MGTQPFSLCSPRSCLQGRGQSSVLFPSQLHAGCLQGHPPTPLTALRGGHAWMPSYRRQANWVRNSRSYCSMTECLTLSLATPTPRALQQRRAGSSQILLRESYWPCPCLSAFRSPRAQGRDTHLEQALTSPVTSLVPVLQFSEAWGPPVRPYPSLNRGSLCSPGDQEELSC